MNPIKEDVYALRNTLHCCNNVRTENCIAIFQPFQGSSINEGLMTWWTGGVGFFHFEPANHMGLHIP